MISQSPQTLSSRELRKELIAENISMPLEKQEEAPVKKIRARITAAAGYGLSKEWLEHFKCSVLCA
jgi:hypothetical protein